MPKLIAGFILGVVTALAVFYWRDATTREGVEIRDEKPSMSQDVAAEQPVSAAEQLAESNAVVDHEPRADKPVEAMAHPKSVEAQSAAPVVPQEGVRPSDGPGLPSADTQENDYPPEIAEMIETRVDKDLQARYENDPREESWATYMEGQLAAYFAHKPSLAQFYISLIDCRTTVCSVHVLGYGPDALTQWNVATADLVSQPWFEFNSMSMNRRNPEPDVLAVVLIITKKPPE